MNNTCRKSLLASGLVAVSSSASGNNGDQMVGFSAISNAMGGAVVALPQDVTTSLSNPAGLSFLNLGPTKSRFDMNLAVLAPERVLNGVESDGDAYVLATGGFAFESELMGDGFTVGVGAYPISGGGVDFPKEAFVMPTPNGAQEISIVANRQSLRIGPAVSYQVNSRFSLGANLSLASNMMSLKGIRNFPTDVAYGYAWVLGTTYKPSDSVILGFAYTSESKSSDLKWHTDDGTYRLSFEDPRTVNVGIGYEPNPRWQLEADVKWLNYSEVRDENVLDGPNGDQLISYGWDDQVVYALGLRYLIPARYTLMAGYNYGESPLGPEDVNNNIGATAIVEHHLSAGLGVQISRFSSLTFSWIRGFENSLTASTGLPTEVSFETDMYTLQFTYKN